MLTTRETDKRRVQHVITADAVLPISKTTCSGNT